MAERIKLDILKIEVGNLLDQNTQIKGVVDNLSKEMELVSNNNDAQRALGGNIGSIQRKWSDFVAAYDNFSKSITILAEKLEGNTSSVNAYSEELQADMSIGDTGNEK